MSKPLTVFTLAMINVAAVSSVRNWPVVAEHGFSSLFFLGLAILLFFIPVSMVSAELATGWPEEGGVFAWVKRAFGHKMGFLAVWLLWAENLAYYPAIISFIAGTIAFVVHPAWVHNTAYLISFVVGLFWLSTLISLLGLRLSGWISTLGVLLGTILPACVIIVLGLQWFLGGHPLQIACNWGTLIPDLTSPQELVFFSVVLASLCGLEMSAVHANHVQHPQKNYPRAILLSGLLILALYLLGVLAIAFVVPHEEISLVAGSIQAFSLFVSAQGLTWLTPLMAFLLTLGAFAGLSAWIIGPSMGLLAAAQEGDLPSLFRKVNKRDIPVPLLIAQAIIVTLFSMIFLVMPTVGSAYWILNATLVQIYLVMYVLLFAAAIKLRYKHPHVKRAYMIPGGKVGIWAVAGLGLVGAVGAFFIGFFPPAQMSAEHKPLYVGLLFLTILIACLAPSLILLFTKPRWTRARSTPTPKKTDST